MHLHTARIACWFSKATTHWSNFCTRNGIDSQTVLRTIRESKNLIFTAPVIRDAQFLHSEKRNFPASLIAVSKLTLVIVDVLQSTLGDNVPPKVFQTQPTPKREEICDLVRSQWKLCQAECVPEEFYVEHVEESNKGKVQDFYWRSVEEEFGLGVTASDKEERQMKRIGDCWCETGQLKDEQGRKKYP